MGLLSAELIRPSVLMRFLSLGNSPLDLFFFLVVASAFASVIWFIDFVINLALSYAFLRFLFNYHKLNHVLFAAFLGSVAGFAIDWISFISSILLFGFGMVMDRAYLLVAFGLHFLAWFALAKFLLRLDAKADEIASYYVALERAGRKPPKIKPLSIRGYSLIWESARPAMFGLLMAFFTNPFWLHLSFGI
ncbi:MAG: hypothetical protein QXG98_02785 [Candidatus Micrarchaeia archaeon]